MVMTKTELFISTLLGVVVLSWYPPGVADEHGEPTEDLVPSVMDAARRHSLKVTGEQQHFFIFTFLKGHFKNSRTFHISACSYILLQAADVILRLYYIQDTILEHF